MDAYIIMITYFLRKMGETKTACKQFVASYQQQTEYLRNELPINIYNQVVGTQHRILPQKKKRKEGIRGQIYKFGKMSAVTIQFGRSEGRNKRINKTNRKRRNASGFFSCGERNDKMPRNGKKRQKTTKRS